MQIILKKVFQRKSEVIMLLAGISVLISVIIVSTTGDLSFWKITKFFYAIGVVLIIFDK
jgi:hypothetical protein